MKAAGLAPGQLAQINAVGRCERARFKAQCALENASVSRAAEPRLASRRHGHFEVRRGARQAGIAIPGRDAERGRDPDHRADALRCGHAARRDRTDPSGNSGPRIELGLR